MMLQAHTKIAATTNRLSSVMIAPRPMARGVAHGPRGLSSRPPARMPLTNRSKRAVVAIRAAAAGATGGSSEPSQEATGTPKRSIGNTAVRVVAATAAVAAALSFALPEVTARVVAAAAAGGAGISGAAALLPPAVMDAVASLSLASLSNAPAKLLAALPPAVTDAAASLSLASLSNAPAKLLAALPSVSLPAPAELLAALPPLPPVSLPAPAKLLAALPPVPSVSLPAPAKLLAALPPVSPASTLLVPLLVLASAAAAFVVVRALWRSGSSDGDAAGGRDATVLGFAAAALLLLPPLLLLVANTYGATGGGGLLFRGTGAAPVRASGHAVVLGWNRGTAAVLRQMAAAQARAGAFSGGGGALVAVLADRPQAELEADIADALGTLPHSGSSARQGRQRHAALRVVARSGAPSRPEDLRRVAAGAAGAVLVQRPDGVPAARASAEQAAAVAALHRESAGLAAPPGRVVVQADGALLQLAAASSSSSSAAKPLSAAAAAAAALDPAAVAVEALRGSGAGSAGNGAGLGTTASTATPATATTAAELVGTSGPRRVAQVAAQVVLQPGLELALSDLFDLDDAPADGGALLRLVEVPDGFEGRRYRDVRRAFDAGVVVGFAAPSGDSAAAAAPKLNPKETDVVPSGSRLVVLASARDGVVAKDEPAEGAASLPRGLRRPRGDGRPARQHVAVLAFDGQGLASAAGALAEACPKGSRATLVCADEAAARAAARALGRGKVWTTVVVADPSDGAALRRAGLNAADAAVLAGLPAGAPVEADARAVASALQLQALAARDLDAGARLKPLRLVTTVESAGAEETLWHATLSHAAERAAAAKAATAEADALQRRGRRGAARDLRQKAAKLAVPAVELHALSPDALMAGLLVQTLAEPRLNAVFSELLTSDAGAEICLRPIEAFGLPLNPVGRGANRRVQPLTWAGIAEAARARGQTALGVAPAAGGPAALRLAPAADEVFDLRPGDRLVVVA